MTPDLTAIPPVLLVTLGYALVCAVSPFGRCRKCRGFGFKLRTSRMTGRLKAGPPCRRCDATGRRIRAGRWLFNRVAGLYRDGTR
ncbi:hypothetical protein [Streptomyces cacaoi]|uniref:hypothetical protein n=1 Tax=Streptomyces cacaoi TaxID=1898 RepID=UPI00260C20C2|nr:hypothetical protein [Streptomyces cacaoi]